MQEGHVYHAMATIGTAMAAALALSREGCGAVLGRGMMRLGSELAARELVGPDDDVGDVDVDVNLDGLQQLAVDRVVFGQFGVCVTYDLHVPCLGPSPQQLSFYASFFVYRTCRSSPHSHYYPLHLSRSTRVRIHCRCRRLRAWRSMLGLLG